MSRDEGLPVRVADFPKEKFPLRMVVFGPDKEVVFDSGMVEGAGVLTIPGGGPGTARYSFMIFGDGEVAMHDDPTCGYGMEQPLSVRELFGRMVYLLNIVQETGRTMVEDSAAFLGHFEDAVVVDYFTKHGEVGEKMLAAVDSTRKMFEVAGVDDANN